MLFYVGIVLEVVKYYGLSTLTVDICIVDITGPIHINGVLIRNNWQENYQGITDAQCEETLRIA